jgi:peptide/nickel transport system permease protein
MARFLLRRAGASLVVILGVSLVAFTLVTLLPGDPVRALFGFRRPTVGQVEEIPGPARSG